MVSPLPILGVVGAPVLHSMSPVIFRALFAARGREAAYLRVAAASAQEAVAIMRGAGLRALNVTAPFKEGAARLADELSPDAEKLGAANCLLLRPDGALYGANTDPEGVAGSLAARGFAVAGKRCLVLGAGGAGRSAAWALVRGGGSVTIANRGEGRARELAARLGCSCAPMSELPRLAAASDIVVSALSSSAAVSSAAVSSALPEPASWLRPGLILVDADYREGLLASAALAAGCEVVTGLEWLLHQALPAYELFLGRASGATAPLEAGGALGAAVTGAALDAGSAGALGATVSVAANYPGSAGALGAAKDELELVRAAISGARRAVAKAERAIVVVGLPASGKTSVGRVLASLESAAGRPRRSVDSDDAIEAESGMTVPEIFAAEGEASFRAREEGAIASLVSKGGGAVISVGGGAPTRAANRELFRSSCLTIWLYASPSTALARSRGGARPLLAGGSPLERMLALDEERRFAYASSSELLVSTEGRDPESIAEAIHDEISRSF